MQGWIQLHRKLLKNDMWQELNSVQKEVTITLLLMASYKEKKWEYDGHAYEVKPGQLITSLDGIMKNCSKDVTESKLRTTLKKLKKWGFLDWEPQGRARLITITNWANYQVVEDEAEEREPEPDPQPKPKPEKKKEKKKDGKKPSKKEPINHYDAEFEELWQDYPNKKGKAKALKSYRKHRKDGVSAEDFQAALERYKKEIKVKETPQQYIKHGSTFFHSGFEDYLEDNDSGGTVQVEPQRLEMPTMDFLQQQLERAMENLE